MVAGKTYLYTYDNAGNITNKKTYPYTIASTASVASKTPTATYTYTYEDANWGDRLSSYRDVPFAYDSLGNPLTYYNGTSYTMQWQNGKQLEKVIKGSTTYTFTYDAEGRRTSKRWSSGRIILYVWDGDLLIGEYVVGQETITYSYDASGSPVGFTYTDHTGYYEGGVPCSFLYRKNPQGDIIGIVDWSGNEFVKYNYDAWGNLISYTMHGDGLYSLHYNMAEGNSFRYRGYYYDRETGFYYLKSRYYDPKIGRFLNADSQLNGSILGYNQYAYCENNPVMYFDPTGTMPTWLAGVLAVGAGIIAGVAVAAMLPAALCAVGATTIIYGTTISSIAVGTAGVVGTVAAVSTAAYTADSMYQAMTGESFLLDTVFQGNADLYAAGAFFTSAATMGLSYFASLGINNGVCFVAGTLVQGENGSIPIEEIKEGMLVYAHHPETGETALKEVVRTFVRESNELVHIDVNGEQILTTPEHPFWVPEKGWTSAIHLRAGDRLQLLNGEYVIVEQIQHELLEAPITVYNFEVADFHTYYVGQCAMLVHNTCGENANSKVTLPKNGTKVNSTVALGMADDFLGPGYTEKSPGRFVSADGFRQVRMANDDILGSHAGGPHINFDRLSPSYKTVHVYIFDE